MLRLEPEMPQAGAKILIIGVGGGGNNTVDRMIREHVVGVEYYCLNTDRQQLLNCSTPNILQIGGGATKGLGAGADPQVGKKAAMESQEEIAEIVRDVDMVFVTCGMGGGTGTGAAPVVAGIARAAGALTIGVVTTPFRFEAKVRMNNALQGIEELKDNVDTLIVVPNEKLLQIVERGTSLPEALKKADEVLQQGIRGITDLINIPGLINLDFADIRTVLQDKGMAHFGMGEARGADKCIEAVKAAANSPLLETSIINASDIIINLTGEVLVQETNEAGMYISQLAGEDTNVIFGVVDDPSMEDCVRATMIAAGLGGEAHRRKKKEASLPTVLRPVPEPGRVQERPKPQEEEIPVWQKETVEPAFLEKTARKETIESDPLPEQKQKKTVSSLQVPKFLQRN